MAPWAHHQKVHIIARVLWLNCQVAVDRSPHVFLVPQTLNPHRGNFEWLFAHRFIQRLGLPEGVIGWVFRDFVPPRQLVQAPGFGEISPRTSPKKIVVVFISLADDSMTFASCRGLL